MSRRKRSARRCGCWSGENSRCVHTATFSLAFPLLLKRYAQKSIVQQRARMPAAVMIPSHDQQEHQSRVRVVNARTGKVFSSQIVSCWCFRRRARNSSGRLYKFRQRSDAPKITTLSIVCGRMSPTCRVPRTCVSGVVRVLPTITTFFRDR